MRVSSGTIYDLRVSAMNRQQTQLLRTQQQISANRRMLTPSDDPIASARALEIGQADAINTQYGSNAQTAAGRLSLTEQALGRVTELLQSIRQNAVTAGNGSFTAADRATMAQDIQAMYDELLTVANTTDGESNYLFSGFQTDLRPFAPTGGGVQYQGDDGQRLVQVASGRQIAVSESGADVFARIRSGNGSFTVSAPGSNTGNPTYSMGAVTDATALTGNQYQIVFSVTGTTTTYDVLDLTSATTILSTQPYTSGDSIAFDGMSLEVSGTPAAGDIVQIDPSTDQDLFATVSNLVAALRAPAEGPADQARLQNALTDALVNLDQDLNNVSSVRAGVGTRMRETDDHQNSSEDLSLQYKQVLSKLQDLDYAKAISELIQQQTTLQAAQKTFVDTARLSIFNYL